MTAMQEAQHEILDY